MPSVQENTSESQGKASEKEMTLDQLQKRLGDSGTERFGGAYQEEYANEWKEETRIATVEEMRRGDGAVKGILRAIKTPLMGATWTVTSADNSKKGEEIRLFVEQNIFGMRRTWKEFLREALAYLDFGFYPFELIWEKRGGKIWLADLEPRIPRSVFRWRLQDGSFGIVQLLKNDEVKSYQAEIPAGKLLILTNDKEGDDVTGQSILRAAHKHWYYKNNLYSISAVAAERYGVGIPTVMLPEGSGDREKDSGEDMAKNVSSNEQSFMALPHGWDFKIVTPTGNPLGAAIENQINHHNAQIMLSVLASFMNLGTDGSGGGSFALSQDQSSFFLNMLRDVASYLREQFEKQVIRRMVDLNFGPQKKYPELNHTPLGDVDYAEFSNTLVALKGADLVDADPRLKQFVHGVFNLPKISDERMEMMEEQSLEAELSKLEAPETADGMELPPEDTDIPEEDASIDEEVD